MQGLKKMQQKPAFHIVLAPILPKICFRRSSGFLKTGINPSCGNLVPAC